MSKLTKLSDSFSTSPQIDPSDAAFLARHGFRSIVNLRPDGEGGASQPLGADIAAAARAAGLLYLALPVASGTAPTQADVEALRRLLGDGGGGAPAVGFCGSGGRAAKLYALSFGRSKL